MLKAQHKSNMFVHVVNTQNSKMDNLSVFFKYLKKTKCALFLLKIKEGFNIDD
jgi:hypothetical protein